LKEPFKEIAKALQFHCH